MTFDPCVPNALKKTQVWFGGIISQPLGPESTIQPITPSGNAVEEEAWNYIAPSPTLKPAQRIQIYNQQYWWRLIDNLQDAYPLVTRLFGYEDFNETIAIPYLLKYPPRHWSLNFLGDQLPQWVEEEYQGTDKELIIYSAKIDHAYLMSFVAGQLPFLKEITEAMTTLLQLQPHVYLFSLPYDLFQARTEFLKEEPEYWVEHDFPPLVPASQENACCFLLFRNMHNNITIDKLSLSEYTLLSLFKTGMNMNGICAWLEQQDEESILYKEASEKLHIWLQRWVALCLLTTITTEKKRL
jgi:hypothetical protein